MKTCILLFCSLVMANVNLVNGDTERSQNIDDPFLWLEEIEGEQALEWVHARNKECFDELQSDDRYEKFLSQSESLLNAKDRIPYGSLRGKFVYNFWQDSKNVRGIIRRTSLDSYRSITPKWETVLSIDELAKAEKENWVYKGSSWLTPNYERCLIKLSRGGTDASVYREFDAIAKHFVEDGFEIPEAKSGVAWLDRNTLLIGTDWGQNSLTESGYPRIVKLWKRGKPLDKAEVIFEGQHKDIGIWPRVMDSGDETLALVEQSLTFFTGAYHLINTNGKLIRLPLQDSADLVGFYSGRLLFTLREAWEVDGKTHPQGALLAINAAMFQSTGKLPVVETIFTPNKQTSIEGVTFSRSGLYITLLQNVKGLILRFKVDAQTGKWISNPVPLPKNGTVSISSANIHSDTIFVNYEDYITPDRLSEFDSHKEKITVLKSLPSKFNASELEVNQHGKKC